MTHDISRQEIEIVENFIIDNEIQNSRMKFNKNFWIARFGVEV